MGEIAIRVEKLGKQYRIGSTQEGYKTLRESMTDVFTSPFRKASKLFRGQATGVPERDEIIWALKDVSFEVKQGEVVGIIGHNGAGKSTLLKILSRITEPSTGSAEIHGRVGSLLEVGTGFHPELTGRENIYLNGAILGMRRTEIVRQFDEIVAFAEIEKFIDTPVKHYSSGMYLRLAFAVAAHLDPEILLVDEVLAVGDAQFQKKCLGKMDDVAREGSTVILVSHNMAAIQMLCQRGILLESGQVAFYGDVADCLSTYLTTQDASAGTILDHLSYIHPHIEVFSIKVNESELNEFTIPLHTDCLKIEIEGVLKESIRMDVEVRVNDIYERPLAFYSRGHECGKAERYEPGPFHLVRLIEWPRVMRGEYYLDIYLTEPSVRGWVDFPRSVRIISEGTPTATGLVFDYYKDKKGWLFLRDMPY